MIDKFLYDLTSPQKTIWLTEQFYKGTSINNVCGNTIIHEKVDFEILKKSINMFLKKNDAMRIKIKLINSVPKQYIDDFEYEDIEIEDVVDEKELVKYTNKIAMIPFEILESKLYKFYIFRFPDGSGAFHPRFHHIVSDAWTMSLMVNQIIENYRKLTNYEQIEDENEFSYIDYINSDKEYLNSDKYSKDKEYWNNIFNEAPIDIDISNAKYSGQSIEAKRLEQSFSEVLCAKVFTFCKEHKISVYSFLMSIYMFYLNKITNIEDISVGTPILNRTNFAEKNTIGMYINTNVFKTTVNKSLTFSEFCEKISKEQFGLIRHQKYPFFDLQNDLKEKFDINKRLYNIAFSYQNARTNHSHEDIDYFIQWSFNGCLADLLQIHVFDMNDTGIINIYYDYRISAFNENDLNNLHKRVEKIVEQVVSNPQILLSNVDIITDEESVLLNTFNNTSMNLVDDNIINLISNPDYFNNTALVYNDETVSYDKLLDKSNSLAKVLITSGIKPGDNIGLLFKDKNIDLIVSILAVLKAGACFLGIYQEYPNERIKYMLEDSNCKLLITDDTERIDTKINKLDIRELKQINEEVLCPEVKSTDNAYIIYTSGSTGNPKGCILTHKNLINFVYSFYNIYDSDIKYNDRFISITNICFDVSICEIFVPLFFGAGLYLYKDMHGSNITEICKYITENNITFAYFPPSLLEDVALELKNINNTSLDKLLVGVEPIQYKTLSLFYDVNSNIKIVNGYGPSETTICSTMYKVKNFYNEKEQIVSIGFPIGNTKIYILDNNQKEVPINVAGEIYIVGDGVGKGYINRQELNTEKFIILPNGEIAYRTGDIAKWLDNGNIMFSGRQDNQIKLRGYRIDIGEIEANIVKHKEVKNAVVLQKDNKLIGYITVDNTIITVREMREFLSNFLPYYMIPSNFIFLDVIPLTPNGKIDKNKLMEIKIEPETEFVKASTEIEKILESVWKEIFKLDKISVNSNFFDDLEGDSLSAMRCVALLLGQGIVINTQDIYDCLTIRVLAEKIKDNKKIQSSEKKYVESVDICREKIDLAEGDILITGSTGFLGSHILFDLIKKTNKKIFCIIRGASNEVAQSRLKERLKYYFKDELDKYFGDRIIAINGDFSQKFLGIDEQYYKILKSNIKTVINSAGLVKHYGKDTDFYASNIESVKNLVDFCLETSTHLVHISTISVSGNKLINKENVDFTEQDLYIGQNLDNIYIKTKFEAEQLIINNNRNGLISTIFRVGNIMWRTADGIFQVNEEDNAFLNRLKSIINIKAVPNEMLKTKIDMTPVDLCSKAIVKILTENNTKAIYHVYNKNIITIKELISYFNENGNDIKVLDIEPYKKIINELIQNNYDLIQGLINDLSDISIYDSNITIKQQSTDEVLEDINFEWNIIANDYLSKKRRNL